MDWTDTALVLRVGRFRETDLWLRLLTRHHGVVSAFAFGGSRSRRRFAGCLDLLNVIQVRVKSTQGGQYLCLEEGTLLEGPRRLRSDWRRLGMLMNCVRFVEAMGVSHDGAERTFALARAMLRLVEEAEQVHDVVPVLFRLRLASEHGYALNFTECGQCGRLLKEFAGPFRFQLESGSLICPQCAGAGQILRNSLISHTALGALDTVQTEDPLAWNSLPLAPEEWRTCARLADGYVQFHLGLSWENGRFRRH